MTDVIDATAWSAALLGVFSLFAAIGTLRQPGIWLAMVREIERSPALQLLAAGMEMAVGAWVYLANPWAPADWLACAMKILGGGMMVEALIVAAFPDRYLHFWLRYLGRLQRGWALATLLLGVVLLGLGLARFA